MHKLHTPVFSPAGRAGFAWEVEAGERGWPPPHVPLKNKLLFASQRIEIGALIHGTRLDPRAFRWAVVQSETTRGAQVTRLEYANGPAPAYFQFDRYRQQHYAVYSWGEDAKLEEHVVGTWPHQVMHVARWMAHLETRAQDAPEHSRAG